MSIGPARTSHQDQLLERHLVALLGVREISRGQTVGERMHAEATDAPLPDS